MPTQAEMFFNQKWSRYDDNSFLTNLEFFAHMEKRPITKDDREILKKVRDWLNPKRMWRAGISYDPIPTYTLTDIYRRFEFAELRYNTWKHIIGYAGVTYDKLGNTINLTINAMMEICEMHSLGEAYLFEPEYRWRELRVIFGPHGPNDHLPCSSIQNREFSKMMEEMLADLAKEDAVDMEEDETSEDEEIEMPKIPTHDMMSTTKGKGCILADPVSKMISPHLRVGPMKMKEDKGKASCSAAVKKLLKF